MSVQQEPNHRSEDVLAITVVTRRSDDRWRREAYPYPDDAIRFEPIGCSVRLSDISAAARRGERWAVVSMSCVGGCAPPTSMPPPAVSRN